MQYRAMPKHTEEISVLGYGCMRLPGKGSGLLSGIDPVEATKQIRHAIDNGVNYLDTAYPYHGGASESFLGEHILKDGYREKVKIATKLPCFIISKKAKIEEIFNKQMKKLQVDYIDYYLLHSLNGSTWDKMVALDITDFMDKVKREGKVKYMGFSFHGKYEDFIRIVDGYDWDFTQVQFNIIDENFQAGIRGIEYAHKKGLGVIAMEGLRGGALVGQMPKEITAIYDESPIKRSPADWAFSWIYNNPAITMVLSGMNDIKHIDENIRIASSVKPNSLTEQEMDIINRVRDKYLELMTVGCTGCEYCLPCPAGIDIPGTFKHLNNYHMFGKTQPKLYHMAYGGIMTSDGKSHFTNTCIDCGQCEKACPQFIPIRQEFKKVQKDLETPIIRGVAAVVRPIMNLGKKRK